MSPSFFPIDPHWLSTDACLVLRDISNLENALIGDESICIQDAIPSRVKEFTAGRSAAHEAMKALGFTPCAVLQGMDGEPVWPKDICGSISHNDRYAVALVALKESYESVGVDIDDNRPITDVIARDITWAKELRLLDSLGICEDSASTKNFVFSAKEAIFKCQYAISGQRALGFQQVRLVGCLGQDGTTLEAIGWRVSATISSTLKRITVTSLKLGEHRIACAIAQN